MKITYTICQEEDSSTLIESIQYCQPELPVRIQHRLPALIIVELLPEQSARPQVLVSHTHHHDGQGGVDQVEDGEVDTVNGVRARPGIEELPPEQHHCICLAQQRTEAGSME